MANPSPDEGVRAALPDDVRRLARQNSAQWSDEIRGDVMDDIARAIIADRASRAALSTPVPEEGLPRGTASAAEGGWQTPDGWKLVPLEPTPTMVGKVDGYTDLVLGWGGSKEDRREEIAEAYKLMLEFAPVPLTPEHPATASALPSPLPPQGEPVAWTSKREMDDLQRGISSLMRDTQSKAFCIPLYTAEALAAERARADSEAGSRRSAYEYAEAWETEAVDLRKRLIAAEARADKAEEDRDFALYCLYHADFAEIGMRYPDDGVSICTGLNLHALAAAKQLQKYGLVTINDSPAGPLVAWAPGRGRARNILKETPHDER